MANLIITVISIALVAVAALMGAYYGGTAFLSGQAKSFANTLVTQGDQITSAWAIRAADNGGSWTISALSDLTTSTSTTAPYLSSVPTAPTQAIASAAVTPYTFPVSPNGWSLANLSAIPGTSTTYNGVYVELRSDDTGLNVCNQVASIVGGTGATPTQVSLSTQVMLTSPTRKFDCTFYNSSAGATVTNAAPLFMYYRAK